MNKRFDIELLPEAVEFVEEMESKAREKVYYNMRKSQIVIDNELFKKLNDHIWEFRTLYNECAYRFFAFWNNRGIAGTCVIVTHGIVKKSGKTPAKEISKADNIRKKYLKESKE